MEETNGYSELPSIEKQPAPTPSMRAAIVGGLVAAVIALVLFSWIADQVGEGRTRQFDDSVRAWVHQFASPPLTTAMKVISALGSEVLAAVFIVSVVVFLRMKWQRAAVWMLLTMAGGLILEVALKHGFHRTRPAPFFGVAPHSYSFPSGHSLMSFCIYGVLAGLLTARIRSGPLRAVTWVTAGVLVAAIGLSRIYLGVHYPSDVLAGYVAAALWVSTLIVADRVRKHRRAHNDKSR
jgi:undecaprenyl-diphosphatase